MSTIFPDELALAGYNNGEISPAAEGTLTEAEASFEEVFQRFEQMVFNLAFRILGNREDALEVSQEVFLTVYEKLGGFRGDSSLKTWIYRITVNRAANRCRWWNRMRRRGTVSLDRLLRLDGDRNLLDVLPARGRSPEEQLLVREQRREIARSLLCLPVPQRAAVVMRDIEGLSYEEIAETLEISLGTVKSRIARGREGLKRRLNGVLG